MGRDRIARQNFSNARLRAMFQTVYSKLKKEDDCCLPSLSEILDITHAKNENYIGIRTIPLDLIIGSEGRYEDFNRHFLPRKAELQSRWTAIDEIIEENKPLPPISVFKIGEYYFVRDGNHRVSVAKARKKLFIEAEVTEYDIEVPITRKLTVKDKLMIQEHVYFLEATRLNHLGKGTDIKLSRPRSYRLLLNIIQHFAKSLELETGQQLKLEEAAREWYYRIFLPFAEEAYLGDLLSKFPNRTTGDLYVWVQLNWEEVKDFFDEELNFLEKSAPPIKSKTSEDNDFKSIGRVSRTVDNRFLTANFGLVATCSIFNINFDGDISVAIVKRKYHPFEAQWSLPIAMIGIDQTSLDAGKRCLHDSLGIRDTIRLIPYKTFDGLDRSPFGRVIAFGMLGIHYGENIHMSAGGIASEIKLINLKDPVQLVYDHNEILMEAYNYLYSIRNNFTFIKDAFPDEIPLKYIRRLLREIRAIQHRVQYLNPI